MEQVTWCHCKERSTDRDLTLKTTHEPAYFSGSGRGHVDLEVSLKSCSVCGNLYRYAPSSGQVIFPEALHEAIRAS